MMNLKSFLMTCFIALIATAGVSQAQSSYERMRTEILERQQSTRSQIETLDEQIETYTRRLDERTEEYDEEYQQFEELNRLISLQQERLRQSGATANPGGNYAHPKQPSRAQAKINCPDE